MNVLGMCASSWQKHVPLEERVGQLNNGTQGINNVKNIEGPLHRGTNSMEMKTSKKGMRGAKLFERDPQLFDRRLETHRRLKGVTEKQREEYLGSLPCVLCGRVGGSCDCTHQKEEKEKTKAINLLQRKRKKWKRKR